MSIAPDPPLLQIVNLLIGSNLVAALGGWWLGNRSAEKRERAQRRINRLEQQIELHHAVASRCVVALIQHPTYVECDERRIQTDPDGEQCDYDQWLAARAEYRATLTELVRTGADKFALFEPDSQRAFADLQIVSANINLQPLPYPLQPDTELIELDRWVKDLEKAAAHDSKIVAKRLEEALSDPPPLSRRLANWLRGQANNIEAAAERHQIRAS